MAEIRFNPLTGDWVMIASHRQNRPQMPKDWCPFCPGSGKVPSEYDVYCYDNDFPALSATPPSIDDVTSDFFKAMPSYGKCEVVLYSPKHTATLPDLTDEHLFKLTKLWQERFNILSQDEKVKYVFIFENRGEAVGVTMPHPHGQIYAYPFLPKKLQLGENNSKEYMDKTG
ncbi:MAG: galactose-1-phosphate uridylyltransferase, partial [Oscillospiraceae bacterium]